MDKKENKKKIVVISVIVIFVIGIILVIINRDKIPFVKLMSNSIFELTEEYTCEEGYIQNGTECQKTEEIDATPTSGCETGYTEINGSCEKNEIINATYQANCESGYTYNAGSGQCELREEATADVLKKCPSGYTRNGERCENRKTAKCDFLKYTCPGKGAYVSNSTSFWNGLCAYKKCPSGYEVSGGKCYKVQINAYKNFSESWVTSAVTKSQFPNKKCSKGVFMHTGSVKLTELIKDFPSGKMIKQNYNEGYRYARMEFCRTEKGKTKNIEKCSDGYKTIVSGECAKEPTKSYICGNGYVSNGDGTGTKIETANLIVNHICGNGYSYNKEIDKCERITTKAPTGTPGYVCEQGYTLSGNKCIKNNIKEKTITYTCPAGYNLEGTKCKRTITKEGIKKG